MKIYIEHNSSILNYKNIEKSLKLLKFIKELKYIEFYSLEGIYKQEIYNLYKLYPIDKKVIKKKITIFNDDFLLLFDDSYFEKKLEYNLPINFIKKNIVEKRYNLSNNSLVELILYYENDNLINYLFEINDKYKNKIDDNYFNIEFSSFLSILKNI